MSDPPPEHDCELGAEASGGPEGPSQSKEQVEDIMYGWLTANSPGALKAETTYQRERLSRDWGWSRRRGIRGRRQVRHERTVAARTIPAQRSAAHRDDQVRAGH